ncbi:hypothetical protein [Streptomyces sp. NPDC048172]|uniref:hypothetical protein n=1 Tax=Streptomyces sp. NPDC048172 TaxID=3365505 RepID=UPI0037125391
MSTLSTRTTRRAPAAAAVAVSAALLLGACGGEDGGGGGKSSDAIEGAGKKGDDKSASESASPSKEAGAPEFDLPDDLKLKVEKSDTGDETKDQVLGDAVNSAKARLEAYTKGKPATANMVRYFKYPALPAWGKDITRFRKRGVTNTGEFRYYDFKVRSVEKNGAWVTYCEDQHRAYAKEIKSGKVLKTKPSKQDYTLFESGLAKNSKGEWQVTQAKSTKGEKSCVPQ